MATFTIRRMVNRPAYWLGRAAYMSRPTARIYNAAASVAATAGHIASMLPGVNYDFGGVRTEIKKKVLDLMTAKACYKRIYDWYKGKGKAELISHCEHAIKYFLFLTEGSYKQAYLMVQRSKAKELIDHVINDVARQASASTDDLIAIRTIVEICELDSFLGEKTTREWFEEFQREPHEYFRILHQRLALELKEASMGNDEEEALTEDEAKDELHKPYNTILNLFDNLPHPDKAAGDEMLSVFLKCTSIDTHWAFQHTDGFGFALSEYAMAGLDKIRAKNGLNH